MDDALRQRLADLPEGALQAHLERPLDYRTEVVEGVLAELARRGLGPGDTLVRELRARLAERDAEADRHLRHGLIARLGPDLPARLRRIRQGVALALLLGLGTAATLWWALPPDGPNPLGYEPMDTKQYRRDLELYGGKVNVLATEATAWWNDRWHGRNLAVTVAVLTAVVVLGAGRAARRRAHDLEQIPSRTP